jgi:transcriptional regulator with XRE-family HTH domain
VQHTLAELNKLKRKLKRAGKLAELGSVSRAAISRILAGKTRPSKKTIWKLAKSLDRSDGCNLIAAFLTDEIPDFHRRFLRVEVREEGKWAAFGDARFFKEVQLLNPEQRQLVQSIVHQLLHPHDPNTPVIYLDIVQEAGRSPGS